MVPLLSALSLALCHQALEGGGNPCTNLMHQSNAPKMCDFQQSHKHAF